MLYFLKLLFSLQNCKTLNSSHFNSMSKELTSQTPVTLSMQSDLYILWYRIMNYMCMMYLCLENHSIFLTKLSAVLRNSFRSRCAGRSVAGDCRTICARCLSASLSDCTSPPPRNCRWTAGPNHRGPTSRQSYSKGITVCKIKQCHVPNHRGPT